jgi:hypothetical protein
MSSIRSRVVNSRSWVVPSPCSSAHAAICDLQSPQNALDVIGHAAGCQDQLVPDLRVGIAARHKGRDLALAAR